LVDGDGSAVDPSIVYYRGPLDQGTSADEFLTRRKVDHALLLLNWYSHLRPDKIELAIQLDSCACLPPPLATLLNAYKFRKATFNEGSDPEILAKYSTFEEYESHTREAFIKDFTAWESRIRALAKTPPPVVGLELPPEVQLVETKINKLLEEPFPISE
jgi:hypothetical protein